LRIKNFSIIIIQKNVDILLIFFGRFLEVSWVVSWVVLFVSWVVLYISWVVSWVVLSDSWVVLSVSWVVLIYFFGFSLAFSLAFLIFI